MIIKTPTTIFSGFLGSGKTTIISNLIDELQSRNQQVVYIKNEIGDIDVDTKVMKGKGIKTKELLNGCICCTLVGPFITSIDELIKKFSPDRIIIEASGAADPSALALMVSSHPKLVRDGVIGIVDVVNFEGYKDLSVTAQNQTKFTDLIVFNKVELADTNKKRVVVGYVRELNAHSPIIEAPNGKVSAKLVFGISSNELSSLLKKSEKTGANNDHENHIHEDQIQTFNLKPKGKFNQEELKNTLAETPKNIFRIKGFVRLENRANDNNTENTPKHSPFYLFNTVGKRTVFTPIEKEANHEIKENLLIFIGFMAHNHEEEVKKSIELIAR
jgi:G3E family GTPase